jgi:hypothetical protein
MSRTPRFGKPLLGESLETPSGSHAYLVTPPHDI